MNREEKLLLSSGFFLGQTGAAFFPYAHTRTLQTVKKKKCLCWTEARRQKWNARNIYFSSIAHVSDPFVHKYSDRPCYVCSCGTNKQLCRVVKYRSPPQSQIKFSFRLNQRCFIVMFPPAWSTDDRLDWRTARCGAAADEIQDDAGSVQISWSVFPFPLEHMFSRPGSSPHRL